MRHFSIFVLIAVLALAASVSAFDGKRKGFVLGGGLGVGPIASVSADGSDNDADNAGLAFDFLIGYAWDEQNMIVYMFDAIHYTDRDILWLGYDAATQGFGGIGYYHYFGPVGKSAYVCGGLGIQYWEWSGWDWNLFDVRPDPDPGFGMLLGGGYEFARHFQVHGSLSFGKTSEDNNDYNHTQFMITVSAVAF